MDLNFGGTPLNPVWEVRQRQADRDGHSQGAEVKDSAYEQKTMTSTRLRLGKAAPS